MKLLYNDRLKTKEFVMKKAFTMIELNFVIVILGILAAVALPRLSATRDDAVVVATSANIKQAMVDLAAFYSAQGKFSTEFAAMTNVPNPIRANGEICATFEISDVNEIKLRRGTNGLCASVWESGPLRGLRDAEFMDGIIIVN